MTISESDYFDTPEFRDRPTSDVDPAHYRMHPSGVECTAIRAYLPSPMADAVKYAWRLGLKDARGKDLAKCVWYLRLAAAMAPWTFSLPRCSQRLTRAARAARRMGRFGCWKQPRGSWRRCDEKDAERSGDRRLGILPMGQSSPAPCGGVGPLVFSVSCRRGHGADVVCPESETRSMKYDVIGIAAATVSQTISAESPEAAIDAAYDRIGGAPSLCWQCSRKVDMGEVYEVEVHDPETGEVLATDRTDEAEQIRAKLREALTRIDRFRETLPGVRLTALVKAVREVVR